VIEQALDAPTVLGPNDQQVAAVRAAVIGGCFSIRFVRSCAGFTAREGSLFHSKTPATLTAVGAATPAAILTVITDEW